MRIPQEHILTLELCRIYNLKLGKFIDTRTKYFFMEHHNTLTEFMRAFSRESKDCSIFGDNCEDKLKKLNNIFEKVFKDYQCLPFKQVLSKCIWNDKSLIITLLYLFSQLIDKYDRYTVGHWLEENLPEFTSIERLHYKVISSLGPYLHNNLINLIMSDVLHYENVR